MKTKGKTSAKPSLHTHLFPFTAEDEKAIKRAMKEAAEYMQSFGRGRKPRMIDRTKYENHIQ